MSPIPKGKDLLEWAEEQSKKMPPLTQQLKNAASATKKKGGCGGCGSKIRNIAKGFGKLITDEILGREPEEWLVERAEKCSTCEFRTFLNTAEWAVRFAGGSIKKLLGMTVNDLPINHEPGRFDTLWCSKCKCCIEAKIRAKDEKCVIEKWLKVMVALPLARTAGTNGGGWATSSVGPLILISICNRFRNLFAHNSLAVQFLPHQL